MVPKLTRALRVFHLAREPRRTYAQSHIDYVIEVITEVWRNRTEIRGLRTNGRAINGWSPCGR